MLSNRRSTILRAVLVGVALVAWLGIGSVGGIAQGKLSQVQTNDAVGVPAVVGRVDPGRRGEQGLRRHRDLTRARRPPARGRQRRHPEQLAAVTTGHSRSRPGSSRRATTARGPTTSSGSSPSCRRRTARRCSSCTRSTGRRPRTCWPATRVVTEVRSSTPCARPWSPTWARRDVAGDLGLQAWVTGPAGFVADLVTAFGGIDGVLLLVALGAVLLILVVVYRSPFLPFVVIFTAVFALCLAGLVVYTWPRTARSCSTGSPRASCRSSWSVPPWTTRCCSSRGTARSSRASSTRRMP